MYCRCLQGNSTAYLCFKLAFGGGQRSDVIAEAVSLSDGSLQLRAQPRLCLGPLTAG